MAQRPDAVGEKYRKKLEGPEPVEVLDYLLEWHRELAWGRQYVASAGGVLSQGLSWREIRAWAQATDRRPRPYEYRALMMMDAASRHPGDPDEEED